MAERESRIPRSGRGFCRLGCLSLDFQFTASGVSRQCRIRSISHAAFESSHRSAQSLKSEGPRVWDEEPFDSITFHTAIEYLKESKPRILFISFGETDDWAHAGNYAEYLNAARRVDGYIKTLWETLQAMPEYQNKTTLIFSPDHGRGPGLESWKRHGKEIPDSKYIWMAFLGPDTPALGKRTNVEAVSQNQIAATLSALLGESYGQSVPRAGQPIADVLRQIIRPPETR